MDGTQAMIGTIELERESTFVRVFRHVCGWLMIAVGLVGLVVPILPGFLFIVPGLGLIAPEIPWAKRVLDWTKSRKRAAAEAK